MPFLSNIRSRRLFPVFFVLKSCTGLKSRESLEATYQRRVTATAAELFRVFSMPALAVVSASFQIFSYLFISAL